MEPAAFVAELRARWEEQARGEATRSRLTPPVLCSGRADDLHQLHA